MQNVSTDRFLTRLTVSRSGGLRDEDGQAARIQGGAYWYVLCDEGVEISPDFARILLLEAAGRPDVGIFYMDHQIRSGQSLDLRPEFDLTLLLAYDYIGLPLAIRADTLVRLQAQANVYAAAFTYALLLFAVQAGIAIGRIAQTLAVRETRTPQPPREARLRVLEAWLGRDSVHFDLKPGIPPYAVQLRRRMEDAPPVTLCITTRQNRPSCILGLLETVARLDYPMDRLCVIVGDDHLDGAPYATRPWPFELTRIVMERSSGESFNYAKKMNSLWRLSATEQIVLMNDNISSSSTDWLQALLTFSMQEDVGGVGARLLYPDGSLQHAGIAGGLIDLCAHPWLAFPADAPTYQDWAVVHREWSMITGAVFATRRSILEEINGFDEAFRLEFKDVDMCLRLKMLGYRLVYTPHAELTHYEKASRRGDLPSGSEKARFLRRWGAYLAEDPMFHPRLDHSSLALHPLPRLQGDAALAAGANERHKGHTEDVSQGR